MKTLEEQLRAAKVGDEVELRCGGRLEILEKRWGVSCRVNRQGPELWVGLKEEGQIFDSPFDVVGVRPKLEDGWTRWEGGECPLPSQSRVRVRHRDGEVIDRRLAGFWRWEHMGMPGDIVAYQVLGSGSIGDRLAQLRASSESEDSTDCFARKSDFDKLLAILIDREAA